MQCVRGLRVTGGRKLYQLGDDAGHHGATFVTLPAGDGEVKPVKAGDAAFAVVVFAQGQFFQPHTLIQKLQLLPLAEAPGGREGPLANAVGTPEQGADDDQ